MMTPDRPLGPLCGVCRDKGVYTDFDGVVHECRSEECVRARAVAMLGQERELVDKDFRRLATPVFVAPGVPFSSDVLKEEKTPSSLKIRGR